MLQAVAGLALGLPGHLSVDSVMQLYEARTLQFISLHPPMMSLLLRMLDACVPGAPLFVVIDQALLTASFALLFAERKPDLGWLAAVAATLVVLNPLLLAYTGIVWKDVLMSHLAAFGFVCLYVAARRPLGRVRIAWAIGAALALSLMASLRQHALVLAIPGVVYAAILLSHGRAGRWGLAFAFSALAVGASIAIVAYADAVAAGEKFPRTESGLRSLATFDLMGIAANGGTIPDAAVAARARPLVPSYTPSQVDWWSTSGVEVGMDTSNLVALWSRSVRESPRPYLAHRAAHFGALLWRPCFPMFSGVVPTVHVPSLGRDIVPELGLKGRWNRRDRKLMEWADQLRDTTPLFNHVFWSIVLAVAAAALLRRGGADALVVFAASAAVFTLGFAIIGISCDFRYLYVLPVAATVLLFALAVGSGAACEARSSDSGAPRQR